MALRHHVIWLTAVFLALALGLVLGSGVLSARVASILPDGAVSQRSDGDGRAEEQNALKEKLTAASQFDTQVAGRIVRDALAGKSVVVFRTPDAADDDVEAIAALVGQAGGTVTGTIGLTEEFVGANSAEKLRSVVNSPILPPGAQLNPGLTDQGAQAGDLLGIALLINRDPAITAADDDARATVLATLRDTGFLTYPGERLAAANSAVVVTGGALPEDAGNKGSTVARFAAALAPHGIATVLAGREGCAEGVAAVALTRADPPLSGAVTTVDDVGTAAGRITTVLALQALIDGKPPAKYGLGPDAGAVTVP